jgi:ribosome maturation factor RimP
LNARSWNRQADQCRDQQVKGGEDVEEQLQQFIGKKVHITFESKRHNGIYNLTGVLVRVDSQWSYFIDSVSDYPEGVFDFINTSRIRSVEVAA